MSKRACRIVAAVFLVPAFLFTFRVILATTKSQNSRASVRDEKQSPSSVSQVGAGMDLWENVCLLPHPEKGILALHSFNKETLLAPYKGGLDQFNQALSLIHSNRSTNALTWYSEPTLLTVTASNGNPAHCLNDVAVSLAMNNIPRDARFVNLHEWKQFLPFTNLTAGQWCYDVLRDANLLPPKELYNPIPEMLQKSQQSSGPCFQQLFLPRYALYRKLPTKSSEQGLLTVQRRIHQAYHLAHPIASTRSTRTSLPQLLLYDRTGTTRRILQNATQIQALLEKRYRVQVHLLQGSEWDSRTSAQEQLAFFQQYTAFVAPHGAQFANLLAASPGSKVVEILCSVRWNDHPENLILSDDNTNRDAWYNINGTVKLQQWFARNGQVLGQHVFHYREKEGCRKSKAESTRAFGGLPPQHISVDVESFVGFVANRLQLEPRQ